MLSYEKYQKKYKSPLESCKKCGTEYIDPRCHELAAEGIPEAEFSIKSDIVLLVIGALICWRGYYLFGMRMLGTPDSMQFLMPSVILLLGIGMVIGGIVDMIRISTGSKRRKYERLAEESRLRMEDEEYVQKLKELGYIK